MALETTNLRHFNNIDHKIIKKFFFNNSLSGFTLFNFSKKYSLKFSGLSKAKSRNKITNLGKKSPLSGS